MTNILHSLTSRFGRILALALTTASLAFIGTVAAPAPANAAVAYGQVTACFQSSYNTGYGTYWGPYGLGGTAIVDAYINGAWSARTTVQLNSQGCASMGVQTGYYWRMRVNDYRKPYRYVGTSAYAWVASAGVNYGLGTTRLGSVYVG